MSTKPAKPLTKAELRKVLEAKLRDLAVGGDIGAMRLALERLDGSDAGLAQRLRSLSDEGLAHLVAKLDHATVTRLRDALGPDLTPLDSLNPVEREQRLVAIRAALELSDEDRAILEEAHAGLYDRSTSATSGANGSKPRSTRPRSTAKPWSAPRRLRTEPPMVEKIPDPIVELGRAASEAASQADGADPDDEGAIETARIKAETVSARDVNLFERLAPRKPERPDNLSNRMAARRRDGRAE